MLSSVWQCGVHTSCIHGAGCSVCFRFGAGTGRRGLCGDHPPLQAEWLAPREVRVQLPSRLSQRPLPGLLHQAGGCRRPPLAARGGQARLCGRTVLMGALSCPPRPGSAVSFRIQPRGKSFTRNSWPAWASRACPPPAQLMPRRGGRPASPGSRRRRRRSAPRGNGAEAGAAGTWARGEGLPSHGGR